MNAIFNTFSISNNIYVTVISCQNNRLANVNDKNLYEISDIEVMQTGL